MSAFKRILAYPPSEASREAGAMRGLPLAAVVFAFAFAAQVGASETAWIDESIGTAEDTGEWSRQIFYNRTTGRATLDGEYVYTPNTPSAGKYVTLKVAATFPLTKGSAGPGADSQAAVKIGENGFQIWSRGWLDVAAAGVTPNAGREYELEFVFDYEARRYSVSVLDAKGAWRRMADARGRQAFALAAKAERISSIALDGKTCFRHLKGTQTDAVLSRAETRRRGADGDPIGNAAALATQVFDPVGIRMASKTWFSTPTESGRPFRRGFWVPPESGLAFRHLTTGPPSSAGHFFISIVPYFHNSTISHSTTSKRKQS